jgi:hypothetical protein
MSDTIISSPFTLQEFSDIFSDDTNIPLMLSPSLSSPQNNGVVSYIETNDLSNTSPSVEVITPPQKNVIKRRKRRKTHEEIESNIKNIEDIDIGPVTRNKVIGLLIFSYDNYFLKIDFSDFYELSETETYKLMGLPSLTDFKSIWVKSVSKHLMSMNGTEWPYNRLQEIYRRARECERQESKIVDLSQGSVAVAQQMIAEINAIRLSLATEMNCIKSMHVYGEIPIDLCKLIKTGKK